MAEALQTFEEYKPTPRQLKAHTAPQRYKLYGGAMGGGKSVWLCAEVIRLSLMYPGNVILLARFTQKDLKKTTLPILLQLLPRQLVKNYNKTDGLIDLVNGSQIILGDLENPEKHKSLNLGAFGLDEATECPEDVFLMLKTRLRRNIPNIRYFGLLATNPEPGWVKDKFLTTPMPDSLYIPALPTDNPHLPENYVEDLKRDLPAVWQSKYIYGSWDVFDSQIIKPEWIKPSDKDIAEIDFAYKIISVDPAITESDVIEACETAITTMGVEYNTNLIHEIETVSGLWSFDETINNIKSACLRHKPDMVGIEEVAFSAAFRQHLERDKTFKWPLNAFRADKDKVRRTLSVSRLFELGLVKINDTKTQRQLIDFPNGRLADRVDAVVYALRELRDYSKENYIKEADRYKDLNKETKEFFKERDAILQKVKSQNENSEFDMYNF